MIWAGSPFAQLIEFGTGFPVGAISYQLMAFDGVTVLQSASITPADGDVSALIVIEGSHNTVAAPLLETRFLTWSYVTATGVVSDRVTYRVNRPLPFAVSDEGVRNKLGVAAHELPSENIDLVAAYAELKVLLPTLDVAATAGDRTTILASNAIEAQAALDKLPSLQFRAARSETSGSDQFSRFDKIDWAWLASELRLHIYRLREALDEAFDNTGGDALTFTTAPRTVDPFSG